MENISKKTLIYLIGSFVAGFCLMTVELTASRVVAPYIGSSVYTWTSVIGVVLLGLLVGYYWGGKIADKFGRRLSLSLLYGLSAFLIVLISPIGSVSKLISGLDIPLAFITLLVSLILFFLPAVFLGMLSPVLLKQIVFSVDEVGSRAGLVSALWSLGSIIGTFATGFLFIGFLGSFNTLFLCGALLSLTALFFSTRRWEMFFSIFIVLFVIVLFLSGKNFNFEKNVVYLKESNYYRIAVSDGDIGPQKSLRTMFLDFDSHSIESKEGESLKTYPEIYPIFGLIKKEINSAFFVGGGSYSMPKMVSKYYPKIKINVAEIDPEVTKTANNFFNLGQYSINTIEGDGRMVLTKDNSFYDLIFEDAFNSFISLPWHLTTEEFTNLARQHLSSGGIYAVNFASMTNGEGDIFLKSMLATFKKVFPKSYVVVLGGSDYYPHNIVLIGINGSDGLSVDDLQNKIKNIPGSEWLSSKISDINQWNCDEAIILSDDYAPVERLMSGAIKVYYPFYRSLYYSLLENKPSI
ncbi:MAG TPA: fused MFS/spermidine synthase [Candidatus Paceibacterota bacterium]|nr:fused MFS/spermidine synthase [Candidatus Paceibacterota bacterium]